jgi:hypothetical protein
MQAKAWTPTYCGITERQAFSPESAWLAASLWLL